MPLLPGLSDDDRTLGALYQRALSVGADYLMAGGLTLRPGRQKELFLSSLEPRSPELVPLYHRLYGEGRPSGAPIRSAREDLGRRISRWARESNLPFLWPHGIHSRRLPRYESLYLLLVQLEEVYAGYPEALVRLRESRDRLGAWMSQKRSTFRRHRTLEPTWIDTEFQVLLSPGQLEALLGNDRLAAFCRRVLAGEIFESQTRGLTKKMTHDT